MSWHLLRSALFRRKGRVALGILSILMGVALATSLLGLLSVSEEKMSRELKGYGANILVTPRTEEARLEVAGINLGPKASEALLDEDELPKLKTIFWKNNILGFAPFLSLVAQTEGKPVGLKPGDRLSLSSQGRGRELVVRGILYSGGLEENQILMNLPLAQELAGVERGIDRVLVSALTIPREKAPADIRYKDPKDMTEEEYI